MTAPIKAVDTPIEDEAVSGAFNPDDYDWPSHLKRALDALAPKIVAIDRVWKYHDGEHPRVWLTEAIRDQLDEQLITDMAENYCDTAVGAPVKRLSVTGFVQPDDNSIEVEAAKGVWDDNDLTLAQKDLYKDTRCAGESFLFAWKDEEKDSGIDATIVDARRVWWPEDAHRSKPSRVVQVWADEDDGVWRATCYYKFVVVRLVGPKWKGIADALPQARYFNVDQDDPGGEHGFEDVPVIRFSRERRRVSIVDAIRPLQDKINKLSANLLVSAEFNAWRKTAILSEQTIEDGDLKFKPNRALHLDPGGGTEAAPTSIWEGSATELANYSDEIDRLIDKLFTKASLPGHMKVKSEQTLPSGAAYESDEGPFVEDIGDMQDSYGASWHDFYELVLGLDVKPQWRNPRVKSDKDEADTVKVYVDAGVPLTLALEKYAGWDDEDIKRLEDAPLSPKEQLSMAAAQALANGGTPDGETETTPQETPPGGNGKPGGFPAKAANPVGGVAGKP